MAEENTASNTADSPATPQGNATENKPSAPPPVPEGFVQVKKEDWDSASKYKDYQPWYDRGSKVFQKPEEIDSAAGLLGTLKELGYGPNELAVLKRKGLTARDVMEALGEQINPAKVEELVSESVKHELAGFRRESAAKERDAALARHAELRKAKIAELAKGEPDDVRSILEELAEHRYEKARKKYADDHPLKGENGPLDDKSLDELVGGFKDLPKKLRAQYLKRLGESTTTPAVAGNGAGNGKPNDEPPSGDFKDEIRHRMRTKLGV